MEVVIAAVGAICVMLGSAAAGAIITFILWNLGRTVHHPLWGLACAVLLIPALFLLPTSRFIDLAIIFALMFCAVLWLCERTPAGHRPR